MHEFEFCPQKPETCRYAQLLRLFIESGSQGRCERSVRHNVSQPSAWHSGIQIFGSEIAKDYSTLYTLSNLCLAKLLLALCSFIWIELSRYHKAALHACMHAKALFACRGTTRTLIDGFRVYLFSLKYSPSLFVWQEQSPAGIQSSSLSFFFSSSTRNITVTVTPCLGKINVTWL